MSVQTLRAAITERSRELLPAALLSAGLGRHKGLNWRECPCSWCEKKREATVVIGSHCPRFMGVYTDGEGLRDDWRRRKRLEYRKTLAELEEE
jgi:hypothetical protein